MLYSSYQNCVNTLIVKKILQIYPVTFVIVTTLITTLQDMNEIKRYFPYNEKYAPQNNVASL